MVGGLETKGRAWRKSKKRGERRRSRKRKSVYRPA
jgi:hypothetical protein